MCEETGFFLFFLDVKASEQSLKKKSFASRACHSKNKSNQ